MVEKRQLSHFRVSVAERHGPLRHPDPNSDPLKPWNPLPVPHLLFCLNGAGRRRRRTAAIRDEVPDDRCRPGPRRRLASANPGSATATRTEKYRPQYPPSVPAPEVRRTRARKNHATREPNSPIRRPISRPASKSILLGAGTQSHSPISTPHPHPQPSAPSSSAVEPATPENVELNVDAGQVTSAWTAPSSGLPLRRYEGRVLGSGGRQRVLLPAAVTRPANRQAHTDSDGFVPARYNTTEQVTRERHADSARVPSKRNRSTLQVTAE